MSLSSSVRGAKNERVPNTAFTPCTKLQWLETSLSARRSAQIGSGLESQDKKEVNEGGTEGQRKGEERRGSLGEIETDR